MAQWFIVTSIFTVLVVCNSVCNCWTVREQLKELTKQYDKSENDLKALQSVGQVAHSITLPRKIFRFSTVRYAEGL